MDYIQLGPTPANEQCASVGDDNYSERSRLECRVYIEQLRREFGPEPEGARLASKSFPHDFGSYREVVCYFSDEASAAYAYSLEDASADWDAESLRALDPSACDPLNDPSASLQGGGL